MEKDFNTDKKLTSKLLAKHPFASQNTQQTYFNEISQEEGWNKFITDYDLVNHVYLYPDLQDDWSTG